MNQDITNMSAYGYIATLILSVLIIYLPRKHAILPLLISGCFMTLGQVIVVGGLHFTVYRILILIGIIRIVIKYEIYEIKLNSIDKIFVLWLVSRYTIYLILRGTDLAFDSHAGYVYGLLGNYIIFRAIMRDKNDVINAIEMFSVVIIPLSAAFVYEMVTGHNLFSIFGGVKTLSEIRDGLTRCQGPFRHPILAGTFGATCLPLFYSVLKLRKNRNLIIKLSIIASTIIVIASASTGPLLAYFSGIVAILCWRLRRYMKTIRWGILFTLICLHIVMKAPVWFLMARVSDLFGGGGYHRSALIDAAIKHLSEWWLLGTTYTANWLPTGITADTNNTDLTNQFIVEGVNGGIVTMMVFILLLTKMFSVVGTAINAKNIYNESEKFMIWCMGGVVFAHVVSMMSITYFDQIIIYFCFIISIISTFVTNKKYVKIICRSQVERKDGILCR